MVYTQRQWENNTLGPIFSEMLYANNTVSKSLVRVLDNIKHKQIVTTISGALVVQPYAVTPVSSATGVISFGDTTIQPVKSHVYREFEMDALRSSRYGADMKSGAAQLESNEFLKSLLEFAVPKVGKAIEASFWLTLLTKLVAAPDEITVAGAPLTAANIVVEMGKIYAAIPGEVLDGDEAKIYVPSSVKQLIKQANLNQQFRDIFTVTNDGIEYLGVPVEFVPLPANTIIAGRSTDFILGTDLAADFGQLEVSKVQANSDLLFIKGTFSLDAAVCVTSQKVVYRMVS